MKALGATFRAGRGDAASDGFKYVVEKRARFRDAALLP